MRVGSGSGIPADVNICCKVGITKISRIATAAPATLKITPGYTMAPLILRTRVSFFSRKVARRSRMVSRIPPASPVATMLVNRSVNTLGCLPMASAMVWPDSTS